MKSIRNTFAAAGAASVIATGVVIASAGGHGDNAASDGGDVILAHSSDRLPSETASDWVTYADHVVAATAVSETEVGPDQEELDRGEGVIGRRVALVVDDVIWSRADAPTPPPKSWERTSIGWQFTGGDPSNRVKLASLESSRVEVGHSYITAIVLECNEDGDGKWHGLGEGSTVPFDDATIGKGELEGHIQSGEEAKREVQRRGGTVTLEAKLAGKEIADLRSALAAATPGKNEFEARSAGTCE